MKEQKGISLIVLVITIIVMVIIAGAVIVSVGNIISESTKATFYQDMGQLEHEKEISKLMTFLDNKENGNDSKTETFFLSRNLTTEELKSLKDTLKAEIVYIRNSFGEKEVFTTKQVWKNNMFECQETFTVPEYLEGLSNDIYYIAKELTAAKDYEYIYDSVSDTCFKIEQTSIGKYIVHSLKYAKFAIDKQGVHGAGTVEFEAGIIKASDGTLAYEPDLNNFSYATQVVYYSPDFKAEYTMSIKEFIDGGCPSTKTTDGKEYTFANYVSSESKQTQVWANVKTTANGLDGYWVWIPRYAYKLDQINQKADVIFVDTNNEPLDTIKYGESLPEGYVLHEAFTQKDGLKGIWISKYDPTAVETVPIDYSEGKSPDITGFNKDELTLVYYTLDGKASVEKKYTTEAPRTIEQDGKTYYWYSYVNTIWANVKTTANGLEAYWVWIPRFAYKLETGQSNVILVDVNNKPLDKEKYGEKIPDGYKLHEAFTQKEGLEGIWISKYDPSAVETVPVDHSEGEMPDITGFNKDELTLVYYTLDGKASVEKKYTTEAPRTIEQDGKTYYWYNYANTIWANVKTTANGLDAYWVWIPRYAYKLESGQSSVILVDVNNKPLDTEKYGDKLPEGYKLHEAFTQKEGLEGIWISKYDPSKVEDTTTTTE